MKRRDFTKLLGLSAVSLPACSKMSSPSSIFLEAIVKVLSADEIKKHTLLPDIPKRDFSVESFGAVADAKVDNSFAIASAIKTASNSGGGRVVFSKGTYVTGPIHLEDNVELHVPQGCELSFSTNPDDYLPAVPTRWEGMELMGYSPLVYAYGKRNVAITGGGVLNGNAGPDKWWPWKGRHKEANWNLIPGQDQKQARSELFALAEAGVPVSKRIFADNSFLRPAFVQFNYCQQILIEDVTIKDAPFWLVHPVMSQDVTVRGIKCISHGPNSDGCDPESCNRVVIEDCVFDTGDDCIAIKSGRNNDGRRLATPSKNILVQNCLMKEGHGGVVIGSEISGGISNLHVRNCVMDSPHLERAIRIKTNASRGGLIEKLNYSDIKIGRVKDVVVINYFYEEGRSGDFLPTVRDVNIQNISVEQAERAFVLLGFDDHPIDGPVISNLIIDSANSVGEFKNVQNLKLQNVVVNGISLDGQNLL